MTPICHPDRKHKAKGLCQHCYRRERMKDPIVREKHLAYDRKRGKRRRLTDRYKRVIKNKELVRTYGITLADFERMLVEQNHNCKICEKPSAKGKSLHVDHCHATGRVRGLLCNRCNWYLSVFDNDPCALGRLNVYLKGQI